MLEICRTTCRYPAFQLRLLQRTNKRLCSRIVTVHVGTGAFWSNEMIWSRVCRHPCMHTYRHTYICTCRGLSHEYGKKM